MWGRCHAGNVGALSFWTWAQATESGEGIYSFSDSVMYDEALRCAVQRGRHHFRVCKPTLPIFSESKSVDAVRTGLLQAKPHGLTLMLPASHLPTRTFDFDLYIVMRKVRKGWKGHSFSCVPPQICVLSLSLELVEAASNIWAFAQNLWKRRRWAPPPPPRREGC